VLEGLGRSGIDAERGTMAKVLAYLYAVGASLALLSVLLPHPEKMDELGILLLVLLAYVVAATLALFGRTLSPVAFQLGLALGTVMITLAIHFTGASSSPYGFFYIWVSLYAFYFLAWRAALLHLAAVSLAYALVPLAEHVLWWLITVGTLAATGGVMWVTRARIAALVHRLEQQAQRDALTGLLNRRAFREVFELELARAQRAASALTIVIADLDHFKQVNDRCGHASGDEALRRVARLLSDGARAVDTVGRVGGEEFALLLPGSAAHGAEAIASRLGAEVRAEFREEPVALSMSFGIAAFPEHGSTSGALLGAADVALYQAKREGRDRAVVHGATAPRAPSTLDVAARATGDERWLGIVLQLAEALDLRHSGTARHCETVGRYAESIARELGMSEAKVARVKLAGVLHDVGKASVPEAILTKPGALTDEERQQVQRHPELGANLLAGPSLDDIRSWVVAHHERPDGKGYPLGLAGEELPLEARILAVADAYEAMTSHRVYRAAMSPGQAWDELLTGAGSQFDATVVAALSRVLDKRAPATRERAPAPAAGEIASEAGIR
jgi:diguanylate cyclase (GGDEF)-like protein/putative nucleotidyltransferase with HDIG domain